MNLSIKNESLLKESASIHSACLNLGIEKQISDFIEYAPYGEISLFVGANGIGKTTAIERFKENSDDEWFVFDAWMFPEKSELWEGFLILLARDLNLVENIRAEIELGQSRSTRNKKAIIGLGKFGINILTVGLSNATGATEVLTDIASRQILEFPAKRVFDWEKLFYRIYESLSTKKSQKKTIILIEDIDRAGIAGAYFLETLSFFLRKKAGKPNFKIIVTGAPEWYKQYNSSLLKSISYKVGYISCKDDYYSLFLDALDWQPIDHSATRENQANVISNYINLMKSYSKSDLTLRQIKSALSECVNKVTRHPESCKINWIILFGLLVMKYIVVDDSGSTAIERLKLNDSHFDNNHPFPALVGAITSNSNNIMTITNSLGDQVSSSYYYPVNFVESTSFRLKSYGFDYDHTARRWTFDYRYIELAKQ